MMRRNSSLGSVGFSARGGRSRRRHGGSSKLPYLILIGILIVLLGIALRIEQFIKDGLLIPITVPEPGTPIYHRILQKTGKT